MTFLLPLLILAFAAIALLLVAGREASQEHGSAPQPVRNAGDALHLLSLGYGALNHASEVAAHKRLSRRF